MTDREKLTAREAWERMRKSCGYFEVRGPGCDLLSNTYPNDALICQFETCPLLKGDKENE